MAQEDKMDEELKAGNVVQLKSGGPKMTVSQVGKAAMTGKYTVWCDWFEGPKRWTVRFLQNP